MRLIDADALRLMKVEECEGHTIEYAMGWKACIEWIKTQPTVDAVPVVRCKDCESWDKGNPFGGSDMCECKAHGGYFLPEDYCSDGDRREEDGTR